MATDTDPLACAAAPLQCARSTASRSTSPTRICSAPSLDADLILIGDLFYEPELATRVAAFLESARRRGATVLFADRTTARRPPLDLSCWPTTDAPLTPALDDGHIEHARVWRLEPRRP